VEGPTDDPAVVTTRERQKRNFIATLLFSQGVPMLCGGDEIGRTQHGNNNGYAQDSEISWYDWDLDEHAQSLLEFTRRAIAFRRAHPSLHRRHYFQGRAIHGTDVKDIMWFTPSGEEMDEADWRAADTRAIAVRLDGRDIGVVDELGRPVIDDHLLFVLNASSDVVRFTFPETLRSGPWRVEVDTSEAVAGEVESRAEVEMPARSMMVLSQAAG
ncbi:MAG: glycogen debranching protein GlgX, partial [Longimicrobiales bacterium]